VTLLGSALLLPLPASVVHELPADAITQADADVEQVAVSVARAYEDDRGASVTSLESENVGFDLLSILGDERRCIEVKGRAGVGRIELTWSEFAKSQELGDDYWLYAVLDCSAGQPRLYRVRNPAKVLAGSWKPSLDVRYGVDAQPVIDAAKGTIA
jgi:hypothetical protein